MTATSVVWFRLDLRLSDNPALDAARRRGAIVPLYVWSPEDEGDWAPGAASRWWLDRSLRALESQLAAHGLALIIRRGPAARTVAEVAAECGATAVFWNRRYEPAVIARDRSIKESLRAAGLIAESFNGALLAEPWDVRNQSGRPFQVFTPFWKRCLADIVVPEPLEFAAGPVRGVRPLGLRSETLDSLGLGPRIRWDQGLEAAWQPGEAGARAQLRSFVEAAVFDYGERRNVPAVRGTSRLSPHLHFGELSPRQVWRAVAAAAVSKGIADSEWRSSQFLAEIGWREFAHHLLFHFPRTPLEPLRAEFAAFPWVPEVARLEAWQRGRTGIPLVDAGMRELWATGWMHNRVRMVVASWLVKNLLQPWQDGARWFWDTLVDADLASNTLGWQWTAGCGADAAPYFRVFNPVAQGRRFDPDGDYVRRWVPELSELPAADVHAPWETGRTVAGYPAPIVDPGVSRTAALAAYAQLRGR